MHIRCLYSYQIFSFAQVTSKPDLYPLVFTCNSDNSKGNAGSSYLMVQYFRNYIVRPAGSLSAASTVDSLSSSFICNANEANTLVPPPYSRAASPELSLHYGAHREPPPTSQLAAPQYGLPRSASQLVEPEYQPRQALQSHYATVALGNGSGAGGGGAGGGSAHYCTRLHTSHSGHFSPDDSGAESVGGHLNMVGGGGGVEGSFVQSQSDQHFRFMANSSCSLSDIFVNNSCAAGLGGGTGLPETGGGGGGGAASGAATQATSLCSLAMATGGTPVIYSNGCIQPNPLHSLENCCQLASGGDVPATATVLTTTASTVSGVSSLSNIGTPGSPPQATSPTGEVREILDQIRQLQAGVSYEQLLLSGGAKPRLQHTLSTPMTRPSSLQQQQHKHLPHQPASAAASTSASATSSTMATGATAAVASKSKKLYACKPPNKALYIPMAAMATPPAAQRCVLKSPVSSVVSGASFFVNRGRVARKGWISRSAPTTPGSGLPPNRLGDDSPLLNEDDEDAIDEAAHGEQFE